VGNRTSRASQNRLQLGQWDTVGVALVLDTDAVECRVLILVDKEGADTKGDILVILLLHKNGGGEVAAAIAELLLDPILRRLAQSQPCPGDAVKGFDPGGRKVGQIVCPCLL